MTRLGEFGKRRTRRVTFTIILILLLMGALAITLRGYSLWVLIHLLRLGIS